jgi:hypothetical protein
MPGTPSEGGLAADVVPAHSAGHPLDPGTREFMESRLPSDFSDVRIHSDAPAADSAAALQANAYTTGRDIYFARGKYAPASNEGKRLLAHELTHTLQQASGATPMAASPAAGVWVGEPDDPLEAEAEEAAEAVISDRNGPADLVTRSPDLARGSQRAPSVQTGLVQRDVASLPSTPAPPNPAADAAGRAVVEAIGKGDVSGVVQQLRGKGASELTSIRKMVQEQVHDWLERWLVQRINRASAATGVARALSVIGPAVAPAIPLSGAARLVATAMGGGAASAEEGVQRLWPVVPLVDKLEIYNEWHREIEQAQIDTIRAASAAERAQAKGDKRLEAIFALMDPKEEYEARLLIDGTPEGKYTAAEKLLARARGVLHHDDAFDAMMGLAPSERRRFFDAHLLQLVRLLDAGEFALISQLSKASEAQALIVRLRQATEGRIDDMAAVEAVVDRAVELLKERRELRAQAASAKSLTDHDRATIQQRLKELEDLDKLLEFSRDQEGELGARSFMGMLSAARGAPEAFGADARRLAEFAADKRKYAKEAGIQRILLARGDRDALRAALFSIHAPAVEQAPGVRPAAAAEAQLKEDIKLREEVLREEPVKKVIADLTDFNRSLVLLASTGDAYNEALSQLAEYRNTAQWGAFFSQVLRIANNDDWRQRFQSTSGDPFGVYAGTFGDERQIMLAILRDRRLPLKALLRYTGNVSTLRAALANLGEKDRGQLRRGWSLSRHPFTGPLSQDQENDLSAFREFEAELRQSQTTLGTSFDAAGYEAVLGEALGAEPTTEELKSGAGRYEAAAIMAERVTNRLALDRGTSAYFTEKDETMEAAGRAFMALWLPLKEQHELSLVDFAALSALYQKFDARAEDFTEVSKAITDMAGTIAATVAGIAVIAATGGAATPVVVATAAAAGAGAGAITRSAFGGDYYTALSSEGARAALLDTVNGALAVVSGGLAARGVELIGLSGSALTHGAARIAGSVAEQATQRFASKVAASAVEAALDGLISGAVSEGFGTMTDDRTWRKGIMEGIVRVGHAALLGGLTGLAGGAVLGAAMPVIGRGASRVWDAVANQSMEKTLERAGAQDLLNSARAAASRGDVAEVNRLADQLEALLNPEEARLLRQQLGDQLTERLGHPPGTATPPAENRALLDASRTVEDGAKLTPEQKAAELDIVARSEPQISREPGYVDEVDLGNGHVWRRTEEGTWCRFTTKSLCGTTIPGAGPFRGRVRVSSPPPYGWPVKKVDYATLRRDAAGNIEKLPEGVVYEFPGGHRVWREREVIRHESVLGPGTGRRGTEKEMFSASEMGLPEVAGMERAHTLGQGTGFESPFGILLAPREVNQIIQNNGIEELLRGLQASAHSGEAFHVSTLTVPHPGTSRLKEIRYRVELSRNGKKDLLFEYLINVGDVPNPLVTHEVTDITHNPEVAHYFDLVDVPERLRSRFKRFAKSSGG